MGDWLEFRQAISSTENGGSVPRKAAGSSLARGESHRFSLSQYETIWILACPRKLVND